jgi:hypothetical protein
MKLPYYAAFFQGEDFIINVSVDVMKTAPNDPHGFIVWLWIKYKNYEWLINLEDQTIEYKNNSQELTKEQPFKFNGNDIRNEGQDHTRYFINIPLANIKAISKNRALKVDFLTEFYKKYKDFKNCHGALISKRHLRYLSHLKEIIA